MPVPGGTTLKSRERLLAPAQEGVALAVALELELDVTREGRARSECVDLHRVVDHELGRDQRVDLRRVAAEVGHRVAHRREIDDGRHAGEVLEQHARRRERDLVRRLGRRIPAARPRRHPPRRRCAARSRAGPAACRAGARRRRRPAERRAGRSRRNGLRLSAATTRPLHRLKQTRWNSCLSNSSGGGRAAHRRPRGRWRHGGPDATALRVRARSDREGEAEAALRADGGRRRERGDRRFLRAVPGRGERDHLRTFPWPPEDLRDLILSQDAICVGGGNTANMLAIWQVHGIDVLLREAWENGVVLWGASAGMICWFEAGVTDSFGPQLEGLDCLGLLPGSACPHYDGEEAAPAALPRARRRRGSRRESPPTTGSRSTTSAPSWSRSSRAAPERPPTASRARARSRCRPASSTSRTLAGPRIRREGGRRTSRGLLDHS